MLDVSFGLFCRLFPVLRRTMMLPRSPHPIAIAFSSLRGHCLRWMTSLLRFSFLVDGMPRKLPIMSQTFPSSRYRYRYECTEIDKLWGYPLDVPAQHCNSMFSLESIASIGPEIETVKVEDEELGAHPSFIQCTGFSRTPYLKMKYQVPREGTWCYQLRFQNPVSFDMKRDRSTVYSWSDMWQ